MRPESDYGTVGGLSLLVSTVSQVLQPEQPLRVGEFLRNHLEVKSQSQSSTFADVSGSTVAENLLVLFAPDAVGPGSSGRPPGTKRFLIESLGSVAICVPNHAVRQPNGHLCSRIICEEQHPVLPLD